MVLVSSPSSLGVPELSVHSTTVKLGDTAGRVAVSLPPPPEHYLKEKLFAQIRVSEKCL